MEMAALTLSGVRAQIRARARVSNHDLALGLPLESLFISSRLSCS